MPQFYKKKLSPDKSDDSYEKNHELILVRWAWSWAIWLSTNMFVVVSWNIFAVTIANPFFARDALLNIIALCFHLASCFSIVLRYISAFCNLVVSWNLSSAFFCAIFVLCYTTFCVIVAWFIVNIFAPAFASCLVAARSISSWSIAAF